MIVGNFNYHQILFALDTFSNAEDKLGYLEKIRSELLRIIDCFEIPKSLPLKMYASKNISIEGACSELKNFIRTQFEMITTNPYDKRYPGEGQLRGLVRAELMNYKKIITIVEDEIENICTSLEKIDVNEKLQNSKLNNYILPQKKTPSYVAKIIKEKSGKIIWENSIGELIELMKITIILDLIDELDEDNLISFICDNFVTSDKERFSPIQVEKVLKMLRNTFWLNSKNLSPKFYQ